MSETANGIRSILEVCEAIKAEEHALVIADSEGTSVAMGQILVDVITDMGAEAALMIIPPRGIAGGELPVSVAAAMKSVNAIFSVAHKAGTAHSTARKEATAVGVRYYGINQIPEDILKKGVSAADVRAIRERTEKLAQMLTATKVAKLVTPSGTNITMSLTGREAIAIHPMSRVVSTLPFYAEAAIAPVEGTAEGTMVVDLAFRTEWGYGLKEPIRCKVKAGRVVDISGPKQEADKLRAIVATDDNSSNIAELGIGTSHIIPERLFRTTQAFARAETAHIGIGRNNDIGGKTWSHIHLDGLMSKPTIELDGRRVIDGGIATS